MPSLYNTVGNLKFYNFVSNQYPSSVPTGLVSNFNVSYNLGHWMSSYAFASTEIAVISSSSHHFAFAKDSNEPTNNETITTQVSDTNRRFIYVQPYDKRGISYTTTASSLNLSAGDSPGQNAAVFTMFPNTHVATASSTYHNGREDIFAFGVKSPSTLVLADIGLNQAQGGSLYTHYKEAQVILYGWLHNSAFPSPPTAKTEFLRYSSAYVLRISFTAATGLGAQTFAGIIPKAKTIGGTLSASFSPIHRYSSIACQGGSPIYSSGDVFLTDLVIYTDLSPYIPLGKVDNRVACMGRGNLQPGRIYQGSGMFGRSGNEQWLCMGYINPLSYTPVVWDITKNLAQSLFDVWKPNELDFFMLRIYTEAD